MKTEITGSVWKIQLKARDPVEEDEPIIILESMKMEIAVSSPESGIISELLVEQDETVIEGSIVARVKV